MNQYKKVLFSCTDENHFPRKNFYWVTNEQIKISIRSSAKKSKQSRKKDLFDFHLLSLFFFPTLFAFRSFPILHSQSSRQDSEKHLLSILFLSYFQDSVDGMQSIVEFISWCIVLLIIKKTTGKVPLKQ